MSDAEKNMASSLNFMESSMDRMWDMWNAGLAGFNWTAGQFENMARTQMDQNQAMRDEWMNLTVEISKQIRISQAQYCNMVREAVMNSYAPLNLIQYYTNIFKK